MSIMSSRHLFWLVIHHRILSQFSQFDIIILVLFLFDTQLLISSSLHVFIIFSIAVQPSSAFPAIRQRIYISSCNTQHNKFFLWYKSTFLGRRNISAYTCSLYMSTYSITYFLDWPLLSNVLCFLENVNSAL